MVEYVSVCGPCGAITMTLYQRWTRSSGVPSRNRKFLPPFAFLEESLHRRGPFSLQSRIRLAFSNYDEPEKNLENIDLNGLEYLGPMGDRTPSTLLIPLLIIVSFDFRMFIFRLHLIHFSFEWNLFSNQLMVHLLTLETSVHILLLLPRWS